jgi:YidC/Oxa1 family membrane protein insertase
MEKRLILAAALSLGVLLLWEWLVVPRTPQRPRLAPTPLAPLASSAPLAATSVPVTPGVAAPPAPARPLPPAVSARAEETTTLGNSVLRVRLSNRGAVLQSLVLLKHTDDDGKPLELVRQVAPPAPRPLQLEFPSDPAATTLAATALYNIEIVSPRAVRMRYADDRIAITKEFRVGDGYLCDLAVSVVGPPFLLSIGTGLRNPTEQELASRYVMPAVAIVRTPGGFERPQAAKLEKPKTWPLAERGFAGVEDNYFLAALIPQGSSTAEVAPVPGKDASGKPIATPAVSVAGSGQLSARAYFGPKDVEVLESLNLGLEKTVDFGWYGILARPLLWLLKRANTWFGNFGVAILVVTLLIRALLFPLTYRSYASMKKMQKLAPKMNAIRDKYKKARSEPAQRQKMNEELMKLYQAEGYNPMSGCLPILLQLPILVAFYNVLRFAVELRHAPFALWIRDLSAVDHTYVLLILMIVSMYVQQAMTPTTADPTQKKIFMAMPLVWGIFFKDMPSGLVLYWLFSNVLTIVQQTIINRMGDKDEPTAQKPARVRSARA